MAVNGEQRNPGGVLYEVRNDNNFTDQTGKQQQCRTLDDAILAITSIRPDTAVSKSVLTAQPVHDVLAYLLTRMQGLFARKGALYLPGRLTNGTPGYMGATGNSGALHHSHWMYDAGAYGTKSLRTGGAVQEASSDLAPGVSSNNPYYSHPEYAGHSTPAGMVHNHTFDAGALPAMTPLFWQSLDPMLPETCFIKDSEMSQDLSMTFHVEQRAISTILGGATSPADVLYALDTAINHEDHGGHQVWTGLAVSYEAAAYAGYGVAGLVSDRFRMGEINNWSPTYERHLTFWLYRAFYAGLRDKGAGTPAGLLTYSVNPYGINYWPGSMDQFTAETPNYGFLENIARWLGTEENFHFDQWVAAQLWPSANSATQLSNYDAYIAAMHLYRGAWDKVPNYVTRFTHDVRVDATGCRTPLHVAYTLQVIE